MQLSSFDYFLPADRIAQSPAERRDLSRLFVYDREKESTEHLQFTDILQFLGKNDVLVLNKSRVLRARIPVKNNEILLSEPITNNEDDQEVWKCMVRGGKFFRVGRKIAFGSTAHAVVQDIDENGLRTIAFQTPNFEQFLEEYGEVPLPPYITPEAFEESQYQTVYAEEKGSVAAPTAGLHFTDELLQKIASQGVQIEYITLHVGLGTFLPVKTDNIAEHTMHAEYCVVSAETANRLNAAKKSGKKITAVGSTSLRTLESCSDEYGFLHPFSGKTDLFIVPPAPFHFVDHLLTNFHLPKSTLLMLIAAFLTPNETTGVEKWKELYEIAIAEKYRFYSFGDAMLIR